MTTKLFSELGLSDELLKAVDNLGFEKASPIQAEAIPFLMEGRDVVGQSQTGSGKTAAFALPAIEKLDARKRVVQVLILCPTRELALQVSEEVHKLARFKRGVHALPIYGGQSYERQFSGLKQGPQIIIGTPGRIMDHMRRGTLQLNSVQMVVLDEADVMLDMGFREDIEVILKATPVERQTVFFSATMPRAIQDLIRTYARDPVSARIEQKTVTVPTVEQLYYEVDRRFKVELLTRLIDIHDFKIGIVFCNTKRMVDELVDHLNAQGYSADRLHGDMSQSMRDRVMAKFRKSDLEFLVATDVAARGIDVEHVQVVFNYDLPYDVEDYVHRIGRTGRAGRHGLAITFVSGREVFQIQQIQRYTKTKLHRSRPPTASEVEEARAGVFLEKLRNTLKAADFKKQEHLIARLMEEGFESTEIAAALLHHMLGENVSAAKPSRDESFQGRDERQPREARERRERDPRPAEGARRGSQPWQKPEERQARPSPQRTREVFDAVSERQPAKDGLPKPIVKRAEKKSAPPVAPKPKPSRATPAEQTRVFISAGKEMGIEPGDVLTFIQGETGLPGNVVGAVDIRDRHLFVDVASEHANGIVSKLNRSRFKGHKVKVKPA